MKKKIDCNWHRYVDLGLPSGLLWATCNIGAKEPWESGLYFSWGNVDGHAYGSGYNFDNWVYQSTPGRKLRTDIPVNAEYDAARANLGGSWRMPTADEFKELHDNCISEWTTQNGVYGRMFISNINGNSVFFPVTGCYYGTNLIIAIAWGYHWSSSLYSQNTSQALYLNFNVTKTYGGYHRFLGFPVRAVLDHPKDSLLIKNLKR